MESQSEVLLKGCTKPLSQTSQQGSRQGSLIRTLNKQHSPKNPHERNPKKKPQLSLIFKKSKKA